jgi:CubicO group peptidase (beta-lactamase class C family)
LVDVVDATSLAANLPPLPQQPADCPWPTVGWQRREPALHNSDAWQKHLSQAFDLGEGEGLTHALIVVQGGALVHEQYDHGANNVYLQYSWSMAKSFTHALAGLLLDDGKLELYKPAAVPEWQAANDTRHAITLDHLLRMRDGLNFVEDYVDGQGSDVMPMLFEEGRHDTGGYTAAKPLAHPPGSHFNYSSGTTNVICRLLGEVIGNGPTGMLNFMQERLFGPTGMRSPTPRFDTSGTFIGSSFLLAAAQDFAKFGLLYLRGGHWDGQQLLPSAWVDYARSESYRDAEQAYGAHWWLHPDPARVGWFYASGYDGQRILLVPEKDVVVVRCGRTDAEHSPAIWANIDRLVDSLATP